VWERTQHGPLDLPFVLIQNTKSLISHSPRFCADHLPKRKIVLKGTNLPRVLNRGEAFMQYPWLHRQHASAILFLATSVLTTTEVKARGLLSGLRGMPIESIVAYNSEHVMDLLLRAIEIQPWSFHLHDRMISILGRDKHFDEIRELLGYTMALAQSDLARNPESRVCRNRVRAVAARIRGVDTRAGHAEKRAAKRKNNSLPMNVIRAVLPPGAAPARRR
jgi:hypothetical protein